jgi:outer membrane protein TolC
MRPAARYALALLLLAPHTRSLAGQSPLSLAEALDRADRAGYANRIAAGETRAQDGQALAPFRGILPTVRLESGYVRTTDPLSAFGFTLRQRRVTPAAFAPTSLNDPRAIGNLTGGLILEQPLFNADAWAGRRATANAAAARRAAERWTRSTTSVEVVRAYWGAVLATEQVRALEAASRSAQSHVRQAEALVRQGMATGSDALLASVKAGEVEVQLLNAGNQAAAARRGLATLMGAPSDTGFVLPEALPGPESIGPAASELTADSGSLATRSDVEAARHARVAAEADATRAKALFLPRLNGFGRLDWNDPDTPFGGRSAWTLGVMLSWSPFAGASEMAELRAAGGRRESAQARADAAVAEAGLDLARARDALATAVARLAIAERSVAQAHEAHRIVGRKYDGGLTTITELFDAAAVETASVLGYASARYDALVAIADLRRAAGLDVGSAARWPGDSAVEGGE